MAFARDRGSPDLKIPDPTKQPSTCGPKIFGAGNWTFTILQAASSVQHLRALQFHLQQKSQLEACQVHEFVSPNEGGTGAPWQKQRSEQMSWIFGEQAFCHLILIHCFQATDFFEDFPCVAHCLHNVACSSLPFHSNHAGAFPNSAQRFAKVLCSTNKGNIEFGLVDVVLSVCSGENFALI